MAVKIIFIFTVLVISVVCNVSKAYERFVKRETGSWQFIQLRANNSKNCRYIGNDFEKLIGSWYYVLRTVTSGSPVIHCGHLSVQEATANGFNSMGRYETSADRIAVFSMTANYISKTIAEISELNELVTGNPEWKYLSTVQMGLCDNDTILFIEPIHYYGGGMVFTRDIPASVPALKSRFGTRDEERGRESTVSIGFRCTSPYATFYPRN